MKEKEQYTFKMTSFMNTPIMRDVIFLMKKEKTATR